MASLNLEKFIRNSTDEQIEVEGFTLDFSPEELPEILKAGIPFIKMVADHNDHEFDKLCNEINEVKSKLIEAERTSRVAEARAEAAEKKATAKQKELEELRAEFLGTPNKIPTSGCRDDVPGKNPWGID